MCYEVKCPENGAENTVFFSCFSLAKTSTSNPIKGAPIPFYRPFTKGAFLPIEDEGLRLFDAQHGDFSQYPHNQLVTMDDSPDQNNKV